MKRADFRLHSRIWERLQMPVLERWVVSESGKMCWGSIGQGGLPGGGSYLSQHFSNYVSKDTGHVRDKLYEVASLTNKFWYFHCTWK